jgi:hypothetical protein
MRSFATSLEANTVCHKYDALLQQSTPDTSVFVCGRGNDPEEEQFDAKINAMNTGSCMLIKIYLNIIPG